MRVSVIIPTYNFGNYVLEAIDSVTKQTYEDLELIVVDDGSTDHTSQVLEQAKDSRLVKIRIKNSGVSAARNTGLEAARGKYIAFLDADDRWLPTKLEKQIRMLEQEPSVGLVFTDFVKFRNDTLSPKTLFDFVPELDTIPKRPTKESNCYVITADTFSALGSTGEMATWVQTILFRADLAGDLRFPVGVRLCEDLHYMLRMYERVQAGFINEPLVQVRRHDRNSYDPSQIAEPKARVISMAMEHIRSEEHKEILRNRLGRAWAAVGYSHYWNGHTIKAARGYFKAMLFRNTFWNAIRHILTLPLVTLIRLRRLFP